VNRYKLGLKPVLAQPRMMLARYYTSDLPSVDSLKFPLGHADAIEPEMFCNDRWGCCAESGSIEEVRLANALRDVTVNFNDAAVAQNYHEITGFNPDDPSTDQGTDVHDLYDYRKTTGIVDADGNRHKIIDYAGLTPGDFDELLIALSLFDMVGIGIQVPDYAETQFEAGEPWHLVQGRHSIEGQHYIPIVGAQSTSVADLYTWGAKTGIGAAFYSAMNVVAVVALTEELLTGDKTPEGVDFKRLAADLPALNTGPVETKAPRRRAKTGTKA
jgi:hypothetical protein